jgi:hypothetical protein
VVAAPPQAGRAAASRGRNRLTLPAADRGGVGQGADDQDPAPTGVWRLAVAQIMGDGFRAMGERWERVRRAAAEPPGPVAAARDR